MERKLTVGDVVEFIAPYGQGYEPGPYVIVAIWTDSMGVPMVKMDKMDGSILRFADHRGIVCHAHHGMSEDRLQKLDFLSAVRKRRHA